MPAATPAAPSYRPRLPRGAGRGGSGGREDREDREGGEGGGHKEREQTCAPDAMDVRLDLLGHVEVDHVLHVGEIEPFRRNVRRHQHVRLDPQRDLLCQYQRLRSTGLGR
eukprot:543297-Rhodomonas_salina.3